MVSDVTIMVFHIGELDVMVYRVIRSIERVKLRPSMLTLIHECKIR